MYVYAYTCKLQTISVHLKTISFVGHNCTLISTHFSYQVKLPHLYLSSALYIVSKILNNNINNIAVMQYINKMYISIKKT